MGEKRAKERAKNDHNKIIFGSITAIVCFIAAGIFISELSQAVEEDFKNLQEHLDSSPINEDFALVEKSFSEFADTFINEKDLKEYENNIPEMKTDSEEITLIPHGEDWTASEPDNSVSYDFPAENSGKLIQVIDGESLLVEISGQETRIRLIGIDVPENVTLPDTSEGGSERKNISEIVGKLLRTNETLTLEYDVSPADKYGRILAYVYLPDRTMLQELLLKEGLAKAMPVSPNTKYQDEFSELEHAAAESKTGLWNDSF